jgi:hypothetical protein
VVVVWCKEVEVCVEELDSDLVYERAESEQLLEDEYVVRDDCPIEDDRAVDCELEAEVDLAKEDVLDEVRTGDELGRVS